ncbi:MAG: MlaD family protein [Myxococcales bacterium]|nr:MlaD family protein [Myxococcales bacterium]
MKTEVAALKVGLTTVVISVLGFFGFRFVYKGVGRDRGPVVWALFRDATGLVDKSRVQVAGLIVGEIVERRLQGSYARVSIRLRPAAELWSNAVIYKKSASLLGEFYLEIDPGTPESPDPLTGQLTKNQRLRDGDQIINVVESITTSDILYQLNETMPVIRDILRDVQRITQGPMQEIAREVQQGVAKNSDAINTLLRHLDQVALDIRKVTAGQGREDLEKSLANVREITEGIRNLVGKGEGEVSETGARLRQNLDNLHAAVEKLNNVLGDAQALSADVRKGKGTVGRLLVDDTIAQNVEQATTDLSDIIRTIGQLQTIVGLRAEYYILANEFKNIVELRLQTRPDKYYQIELVDDPRPTRQSLRQFVTTDDPSRPLTTTTDIVSLVRQFKVSFQFAKKIFVDPKWFVLTLRYGIKESTGGIGGDFDLLYDRLSIKVDLFDFRSNVLPRLRIFSTLMFYRNMFLLAGIDDIMNDRAPGGYGSTGRDYYVGAQLMFNDEDLKALLAIGGGAIAGATR